jgi:hypothetical protein
MSGIISPPPLRSFSSWTTLAALRLQPSRLILSVANAADMDLMMLTNLQDSVFSLAAGVRTIQRIEYAIPNFLFLLYYHLPALSVLTAASIKL